MQTVPDDDLTIPDDDDLADVQWVADFWGGVDKSTVWRWAASKKIPPIFKIGPGISRASKAQHRAARAELYAGRKVLTPPRAGSRKRKNVENAEAEAAAAAK